MSFIELTPEQRRTPQPKLGKDAKPFDPLDPSGILKQPQGEDEAITEIVEIIGVQPTLLGS